MMWKLWTSFFFFRLNKWLILIVIVNIYRMLCNCIIDYGHNRSCQLLIVYVEYDF